MTKRELELRKLKNDQMTPEDLQQINETVANTKRFLEMLGFLPYMREELDKEQMQLSYLLRRPLFWWTLGAYYVDLGAVTVKDLSPLQH